MPFISLTLTEAAQKLKNYIRDKPHLNRIVTINEGNENTEDELKFAVEMAVDDFNITPPFIGDYTLERYPSLSLLIKGAVIQILDSASMYHMRNELPYTDGGINVRVLDKGSPYQNFALALKSEYETKKKQYKVAINIDQGWGGVFSEYSSIAEYGD